jgi:alkylation response protein AidB-like acyl-CoA dehydrogenase
MNFDDTREEAAFRADAQAWLETHAPALPPEAGSGESAHIRRSKAWQASVHEGGWAGITWPVAFGGRGGTALQQTIFEEEQARFDVPVGLFLQGLDMAGPTVIACGTDDQKARYLEPILRGEAIWCQLFSEPDAGSDLAGLRTTAVLDGDEYVVNGQKVWSSGAHYSDYGLLLARTDPTAPKHSGITYFVIDMRSSGIDVKPLRQMTGTANFNEVFLTDVRVPAANVVGTLHDGWRVATTTLSSERAHFGSPGSDLVADLIAMARRRGRADDAVVRQRLARACEQRQAMRGLGWRARTALSRGVPAGPESSVVKLAWAANLTALTELALAVEGPAGMLASSEDDAVAGWANQFLLQPGFHIGGGTDEIQRNIIGERVLGLPREPRVDKDVPFSELLTAPSNRATRADGQRRS